MAKVTNADFQRRYGPWAVVAGASEGLGAEYATQLAMRGLHLVLIARRQAQLEVLAKRLEHDYQINVRIVPLDLSSDEVATVVTDMTHDIDVGLLVYNAALSAIGPFEKTLLADHLEELAVNCRAPLILSYLLGKRMLLRGSGGIVLMSSLSATQGSALITNYAATKAYNRLLAEGLWEEFRSQGVDVLACSAGSIDTPNYQASAPQTKNSFAAAITPQAVVTATLAALGHQPGVVPGIQNRLAYFVLQRLFPRRLAITMMGQVMRGMYKQG